MVLAGAGLVVRESARRVNGGAPRWQKQRNENYPEHRRGLALAVLSALLPTLSMPLANAQSVASAPQQVKEVTVLGNPLRGDVRDVPFAVSSLSGDELLLRRGSTLGETVSGLPGVSSTWFGPNSGRPIIRGLDGDRVRVLSNLSSSLDASSLSYDHNPAIDPLLIERVEVLRGPATLLYGGAAIGGVVNVIDGRIPTRAPSGVEGVAEVRAGGADKDRSGAARLLFGSDQFAIQFDGFNRRSDDYRVPSGSGVRSPVQNSSASAEGGAVGGTWFLPKGYLGASYSDYRSEYGVVAEADVRIRMKQTRTATELRLNDLAGLFTGVLVKTSHSDYAHEELEAGEVGTRFANRGDDLRAEFSHRSLMTPLGALQGMVGLAAERSRFQALGEEAFVPSTQTRTSAIFAYEELGTSALRAVFGARYERSGVDSAGGTDDTPRFGAPTRRDFGLSSYSVGAVWRATPSLTATLTRGLSSRAPTHYELFANGPHVATGAFEVGDPQLGAERSRGWEVGLGWRVPQTSLHMTVFEQRFDRFMLLDRTGVVRDSEGTVGATDCGDGTSAESGCTAELLPEFRTQARTVRLRGIEIEAERTFHVGSYHWTLTGKLDRTLGVDTTTNAPLPRLAPLRVQLGSTIGVGATSMTLGVERVAPQTRVPSSDAAGSTPGYTLLSLSVLHQWKIGRVTATGFVRGNNLADRVAFNASSIDTIRRLAPLPGRSVKAGVRFEF